MLNPGLSQEVYPLRRESERHWNPLKKPVWNDAARYRVWGAYCKIINKPRGTNRLPGKAAGTDFLDPVVVARDFARFKLAYIQHYPDIAISRQHIEAAYALLCKRIEIVPARINRLIVCAMAATVISRSGMSVHLLCDTREDLLHASGHLKPVLETLGFDVSEIQAGDTEGARKAAYRSQITMTTTRECAMDFLRDATNWAQRSDSVLQRIDRLSGRRSHNERLLLRGLPCAIHVDIDSALIDNARTPMMLTRDAHPMHESEELGRSLEMAGQLVEREHFLLTGKESEIMLTDAGQAQLSAWSEQLGGIWSAPHIAETMLKVALLAERVLIQGTHFTVEKNAVIWLVQQRLVPGLTAFGEEFLKRMLLLQQGVDSGEQREITARASFQQIFNRYLHQCGCAHSISENREEFKSIYSLITYSRWTIVRGTKIDHSLLVTDAEAMVEKINDWARQHNTGECRILVCNTAERVPLLQQLLAETIPAAVILDPGTSCEIAAMLQPGNFLIASAGALDRINWTSLQSDHCRVKTLILERSVSLAADRRNLYWLKFLTRKSVHVSQILSKDCALLEEASTRYIEIAKRLFGVKFSGWLLRRKIRHIQRNKARSLAQMRKELLAYDHSMQGLLSFSGRGLYD